MYKKYWDKYLVHFIEKHIDDYSYCRRYPYREDLIGTKVVGKI